MKKEESARDKFLQVLLFLAFGTTGWWSANAILAELPTFVESSPEGKKIANLLCVAIQAGNIFPIVYKAICAWCFTDKTTRRILPAVVTAMLVSGGGMLAMASIFWGPRGTMRVFKQPHSVALLILTMVCGGIGGMSNVTYWALASRYDERCIKAVSTGMTVGGLFAQGVAVAQRAGANPRFSPEVYFIIVAIIQGILLLVMIPISRLKHEDAGPNASAVNIYEDDAAVVDGNGDSDDELLLPGSDMQSRNTSINSIGRRVSDNVANAIVSSTSRPPHSERKGGAAGGFVGGGGSSSTAAGNGLGRLLEKQRQDDSLERKISKTITLSDEEEMNSLLEEAGGGASSSIKSRSKAAGLEYACWLICFTLYGMTYALPSLLPYIVQGYGPNTSNSTNCTHADGFANTAAAAAYGSVAHANNYISPHVYTNGDTSAAAAATDDFFGPASNCSATSATSSFGLAHDDEFDGVDLWGPAMNAGFGQRLGAAPWRWGGGVGNSSPAAANTTDSALKDSVYLWMNVLQNVGDVGGRMSTGVYTPNNFGSLVILCVVAVGLFFTFILATIWRSQIPIWLPGNAAYLLPFLCLVYYFVRGFLVTSTYVWVKRNFAKHEAEKLSSNLGFLGQLGALLSNGVMFVVVQMNLIGGPGHGP